MAKPFKLTFPIGSRVRLEMTFESAITDAPADPTTVTVRTLAPDTTQTDYVFGMGGEIVRDDVGLYHFDLDCNAAGVWQVRGEGTGDAQAVAEVALNITPTAFLIVDAPPPAPGP